jgi:hypothetical protein
MLLALGQLTREDGFGLAKDTNAHHHSAAELLGDWRAAERDSAGARSAASVAALALKAASAAEVAALETETAVKAALAAAAQAKAAADLAKHAATQAAEAAQLLKATAARDRVRANHAVEEAEGAEAATRDRYHDAENEGFPKD